MNTPRIIFILKFVSSFFRERIYNWNLHVRGHQAAIGSSRAKYPGSYRVERGLGEANVRGAQGDGVRYRAVGLHIEINQHFTADTRAAEFERIDWTGLKDYLRCSIGSDRGRAHAGINGRRTRRSRDGLYRKYRDGGAGDFVRFDQRRTSSVSGGRAHLRGVRAGREGEKQHCVTTERWEGKCPNDTE